MLITDRDRGGEVEKSALGPQDYVSSSMLLEERQKVFNTHWHLAGHISEISQSGDYMTLNIAGEPIVVIRGSDGKIRTFFNICIHRGFPLFEKAFGTIRKNISCSYHGWTYGKNGELESPRLKDHACPTLREIETEIFSGFIFFRIKSEGVQNSVSHLFEDWAEEFLGFRLEECVPSTEKPLATVLPINWKAFMENTLEGYHVKSVHPGLDELIGHRYEFSARRSISKTVAPLKDGPPRDWSERLYHRLITGPGSDSFSKKWVFYFVFPNVQISIYPEQIFYLQSIPLDSERTLIRGRFLDKPRPDRSTRLAAYLNRRIGLKVYREDMRILRKASSGFTSLGFKDPFYTAGQDEEVIKHFHHCLVRARAEDSV